MFMKLRARPFASLVLGSLVLFPMHSLPFAQSVTSNAPPRDPGVVHIGVLGLFHPHQLTVSVPAGNALVLRTAEERIVLERSSGMDSAAIRISAGAILLSAGSRTVHASEVIITGRKNDPVDFVLSVPGKITRHYRGRLTVQPSDGSLTAIVTMDRETAVASVVAAESASETPVEALKAQAVATRSYFVAGGGRHHDFDFCDTTHCQFLREPPPPESATARAVAATRDLVLTHESQPFAAMYTRSCSGRTHTPAELGLPSSTYPYFSVECKYCRAHSVRWTSRIPARNGAGLHSSDESARLSLDRRLGWSAIQSNDFVAQNDGGEIIVHGTGQGHGIGLCQSGARALAEDGATFQKILSHYYPGTKIARSPV